MSASNKKENRKRGHGGFREGAGRKPHPEGTTKVSVSLRRKNWHAAVNLWNQKPSHLIDALVGRYVDTGGSILEPEGAI